MITVTGLNKSYAHESGSLCVLRDINLTVAHGEFVAIVGPSGCGKSTLLHIVAGLIPYDSGTVQLAGTRARAGRHDAGIMLQSPSLLPWRNVLQNVLLPFDISGEDREKALKRARTVLSMVGLMDFTDAYPWQLSGGMEQRVALARLLAYDPAIQLMDEPFGSVDELTRERLNLELAQIHEVTDKTVLFVTHSIHEAVLLAHRVVVMTPLPGRIAGEVPVPFERPRGIHLLETDDYHKATGQVRRLLRMPETSEGLDEVSPLGERR